MCIDLADKSAQVNGRTTRVMRPAALAKLVREERDRLFSASFKAPQFMKALAAVYQLKAGTGNWGTPVLLRDAYDILSLRTGAGGYSLRQFAFDLYRLRYQSEMTDRGLRFRVNAFRNTAKSASIPVPRPTGGVDNLGSYEITPE